MSRLPHQTDAYGSTAVRSERASVRRSLLSSLRTAGAVTKDLVTLWSTSREVFDNDLVATGWPYRWRRWDEYPENSPAMFRATARSLRELARFLDRLADQAETEAELAELARQQRKDQP